jgi:hypothetical protein
MNASHGSVQGRGVIRCCSFTPGTPALLHGPQPPEELDGFGYASARAGAKGPQAERAARDIRHAEIMICRTGAGAAARLALPI